MQNSRLKTPKEEIKYLATDRSHVLMWKTGTTAGKFYSHLEKSSQSGQKNRKDTKEPLMN